MLPLQTWKGVFVAEVEFVLGVKGKHLLHLFQPFPK